MKTHTSEAPTNTSITYAQALSDVIKTLTESSSAQYTTATNKFLKVLGKKLDSLIGPELLDQFEASLRILYNHVRAAGQADTTYTTTASRLATVRSTALKLIANLSLPPAFPQALEALIKRNGHSYEDVELRFGSPIAKWRRGEVLPAERSIPKLRAIEEFLGAPGALLARLPHLIRHINVVHEVDPADNLPVDFGKCLRALRIAKDLELIDLVSKTREIGGSIARVSLSRWELGSASPLRVERRVIAALEKALGISGPLLKRYDAIDAATSPFSPVRLTKKNYGFWNETVDNEFEHLAWFKSTPDLPSELHRNKQGVWARDDSKQMWEQTMRLFLGYCRLPSNNPDPLLRGAGVSENDLSIALLLDYSLAKGFCDFRRGRNAANAYNASTISFIAGLRNLVHPDTGYFTQHADRFCHHPRLQHLLPFTVEVKVLQQKETRQLNSLAERFVVLCQAVYRLTNDFLEFLTHGGGAKQTRDSTRHVKKILSQDQPLDCLLLLRERMERSMPAPVQRTKIAVHLTNIALVALMNVKPLRVRTLRELRSNEIYRHPDGSWYAKAPKERFKNARYGARDGWVGKIHESVWPALDRYWNEARPYLTFASPCDRFWVGAQGGIFETNTIHSRFLAFTKEFIPDFAPTGINPHAWRKVISHDNLKTDRINAVTKSAQQLNDLPKTVMKSYAMDNDALRNDWVNAHIDERLSRRKQAS